MDKAMKDEIDMHNKRQKVNVKFPFIDSCKWEDVLDEDLWEDGELNGKQVLAKIDYHVFTKGDWKLMRQIK